MKAPGDGIVNKPSPYRFGLIAYLSVLAALAAFFGPDLRAKTAAQRGDRTVAIAVDWNDIGEIARLASLRKIPVQMIVLDDDTDEGLAKRIRAEGFQILWRGRSEEGDPIFSDPRNGLLPLFEFAPQAGLSFLAGRAPSHLIKAHCLQSKELLVAKENIWFSRLVRAVKERWVRLLYIRFSPALGFEENIAFQSSVAQNLTRRGFNLGMPVPFPRWQAREAGKNVRLGLVLAVAVATPLFCVAGMRLLSWSSPFLVFVVFCLASLGTGVLMHGLGSHPDLALGTGGVRGVKLQLVAPLAASLFVLFSRAEWRALLNQPLQVKHIVYGAAALGVVGGLYLMRSGNSPWLPVLDWERQGRDALEKLFVARPRLKEFLIGHPLLITGLVLLRQAPSSKRLFRDGRLWVFLGLVGQISIMNTFLHFHSPVELGILRSLHGIWLGLLFSLPLCYFVL